MKKRNLLFWGLITILFMLASIIEKVFEWISIRFHVSFEEFIYTVTSPLDGTDTSMIVEAVDYVVPLLIVPLLILCCMILIAYLLKYIVVRISIRIYRIHIKFDLYHLYQIIAFVVVLTLNVQAVIYGFSSLGVREYYARRKDKSTIYEEYYVDPDNVNIYMNDKPRNIIYLYLESMETTYASTNVGGYQEVNYIPRLTELAQTNISFSHNDFLGGANITTGACWTVAALFCTTTGVPFSFPVDGNSMDQFKNFAEGITSLGDILEKNGYKQMFLCGSDGDFSGRASYFEQHGSYQVYDYYYAIDKGYIEEDYRVWWGMEDAKLYEMAKKELLNLSDEDEPFNMTILTVDTHAIDGYICSNCGNDYNSQLANIVACADSQASDFINWCKEQDFYEDTVIVVVGDHLRIDTSLVEGATDRRPYNCIINSVKEPARDTNNRVFTTLDWFPTVLSAMGFEIEGDRLGMGTDLFSMKDTLAEELGFDYLNTELTKYSQFYLDNFQ